MSLSWNSGQSTSDEQVIDGRITAGVRKLWLHFYYAYQPRRFEQLVYASVQANDWVLEVGAGSGRGQQNRFELRGRVARYVGLDPDHRIRANPYLDEACVGRAEALPFADSTFDCVFHSQVAEHFESPASCIGEMARVLKPDGLLLFVTSSRYYYAMIVAKLTPHWFHAFYVRNFGSGRAPDEVFPTFYRLNDDKAICEQLRSRDFACTIEHDSTPPGYLRFSRLSFLVGVVIERTLERRFPSLRERIIVTARKTAPAGLRQRAVGHS